MKIGLLKPDKNQPRKYLDERRIKEMSVSIKNEGIINSIEADKDNVIITGELRWRAAKFAGLKEVPVKVLSIGKKARFVRQMQENLHHNTMSAMDTAEGLARVRDTLAASLSSKTRPPVTYATELSKIFGTDRRTIGQYLDLLDEPEKIKKLLRQKSIPRTILAEINRIPEEYRPRFKEKALKEGIPREAIRHFTKRISALIESKNPEVIKKILKEDYTGMRGPEIIEKTFSIAKGIDLFKDDPSRKKLIQSKINELSDVLRENKLSTFNLIIQSSLRMSIKLFIVELAKYVGSDTKLLK